MKNKLFLISLLFLTINSKAQSGEKFMKLQRVFSFDTSAIIQVPTLPTPVFHLQNIPSNVIWIVKNINYTNLGLSQFNGAGTSVNRIRLSVNVNNSPLFSERVNYYGNYNNPGSGYEINESSGTFYLKEPTIISGGKQLKFIHESVGSGVSPFMLHLFYSVEEYIIE
jgi:hypothetical protein